MAAEISGRGRTSLPHPLKEVRDSRTPPFAKTWAPGDNRPADRTPADRETRRDDIKARR